MAKIEEPSRVVSSEDGLLTKVRNFVFLKNKIDDATKELTQVKSYLSDLVDVEGEEDDKGHKWFQLPEEVGGYVSLKRERRVSQSLDLEEAERILKEKGLDKRCFVEMPVLNEDAVMACLYEGLLTEEEIDTMFPKKITWAFIPSKS